MYLTYKYKLHLTQDQKKILDTWFNAETFIYKWGHQRKLEVYKKLKKIAFGTDLKKELCKLIETQNDFNWLKCLPDQAIFYCFYTLDSVFRKQFIERKNIPSFKKYRTKRFTLSKTNITLDFDNGIINIPCIQEKIKFNYYRPLQGNYKCCTFYKYESGEYYISFLCEAPYINSKPSNKVNKNKIIGLDLSVDQYLLTTSKGNKVEFSNTFIKYYKNLQKEIEVLQGKTKNSKNFFKQLKKVKKLEQKFKNVRNDFYHKTTSQLVKSNKVDFICFEKINFYEKFQNQKEDALLLKNFFKADLSIFTYMLAYKCLLNKKKFYMLDNISSDINKTDISIAKSILETSIKEKDIKLI